MGLGAELHSFLISVVESGVLNGSLFFWGRGWVCPGAGLHTEEDETSVLVLLGRQTSHCID
jgi:hypothetical protein